MRPFIPAFVLALSYLIIPSPAVHLDAQDFATLRNDLQKVRTNVQEQTSQLLVLLKEIRDKGTAVRRSARITIQGAAVRESDNAAARIIAQLPLNREYRIIEERDEWYRIVLDDGREGWIDRPAFQMVTERNGETAASPPNADRYRSDLRRVAETLLRQINRQTMSVAAAQESAGKAFQALAPAEREQQRGAFEDLNAQAEKVREYGVYANHYFERIARDIPVEDATASYPGPVEAQVVLQGGNSTYTAQSEQRATALNLRFDGSMALSEHSSISTQLGRRSEVIQTPYTSNDINVRYHYSASRDLDVSTYAALNTFTDDAFTRNDFTRMGLGTTLSALLGSSALFTADLKYDGKTFDDTTGNAYQGGHLVSTLRLNSSTNAQWQLGFAGSLQSSDVHYLDFSRTNPSVQFRSLDTDGSTTARAEFESMAYGEEATINDFQRGQFDYIWIRGATHRQLQLIAKRFPNNAAQDYLRFGGSIRNSSGGARNWQRSNLDVSYVHFLEQEKGQTAFMDIRADRNSTGESFYWDLNLFTRIWSDIGDSSRRYHMADFLGRFGWTISGVQVGPVVGFHLRLRPGEQVLERDGNSISTGAEARGTIELGFGRLNLSLRYEKDIVYSSQFVIDEYGNATSTGITTRNPSTFQFMADLRIPISTTFDFTLMLDTYNANLDLSPENSLNPIESRSRTNLLAGIAYRFSIQP